MTDLAVPPDLAPAPTTLIYGYTRAQYDLAKRTLMPDESTDDELQLFLATAQRMGLDPFVHQIRAIRRSRYNSRTQRNEPFISIEPGIDGLRLVAERTHEIQAEYGPYWCGPDGKWVDVWLSEKPPVAAKFGVLRKGRIEPRFAVALWREYRQTKSGGGLTSMWENRPAGQLAKCAEALCKRAVFPHELGGIYTSDEMAQAENATTVQTGPAETPGRPWDGGNPFDGDPFEDGQPVRWAIENIVDDADAKWLLQHPEVDAGYRNAVKRVIAEAGGDWVMFWRSAPPSDWRAALMAALDASKNPPASEQEVPPSEAGRSEAGGANHDGTTQPGAREVPQPSDATAPPGEADEPPPGRRPPGGPNRSRPAEGKGKPPAGRAPTTTKGEQA